MAFTETVRTYSAFLYPNKKQTARINLRCDTAKLYLLFSDPAEPVPGNSYSSATKTGVGHQPFSSYPHYLDLVRNEGPISITFRPEDSPPVFVVYAGAETPGEGE